MTERILIFVCGIVVGILIALFVSEDAEAINRDQLPAMHQVAVEYFGPAECGKVVEVFVPAASLAGDDAPYGAAGRGGNCLTKLAEEFFDAASWGDACKLVVHEYGHSVGDGEHSLDPNSIMYVDGGFEIRFAPCEDVDPTLALEDRCIRAENGRYRASDLTLTARRQLRRLVRRGAPHWRIVRAQRRVVARRAAYVAARAQHRVLIAELRAYGVDV